MQKFVRLAVAAIVLAMVPGVASTLPVSTAFAAAELTLAKQAPANVLAGAPIPYTLTAANPGTDPLYNLSFHDVLAPGATYVGPSTPAAAGTPDIYTASVEFPIGSGTLVPQQTLVWSNIADLQANDTFELTFNVTLDPTIYIVGATVDNTGSAYGSTDPRLVPQFDPVTGAPATNPDPAILASAPDTTTTTITAIEITKSEPSPEGELLRGVHDFVTTYTLTVDTTSLAGVNGVLVTDLLPAQLEFLGCNDVDNSSGPEYPGAPDLGAGPPIDLCTDPVSVETVPNGDGTASTLVTWNIGDLPAGNPLAPEFTIRYAAGIPLFANAPFTGDVPTPASLEQGSNLDNNAGASTREGVPESPVTNRATATGTYLGALFPDTSPIVTDDDSLSRTIEDVRIVKSADTGVFQVGDTVRYTIEVDTSEYVSASGITVTDHMPNGMCPVGLAPTNPNYHPSLTPVCDPVPVTTPLLPATPTIGGVPTPFVDPGTGHDPNGGFNIQFAPIGLAAGSSTTIGYSGRMLDFRTPGGPPASGDSFTNTVNSTATTTPIPATVGLPAGDVGGAVPGITDASSWTLVTTGHAIDKMVLPRDSGLLPAPTDTVPTACPTDPNLYIDSETVPPAETNAKLGFRRGDIICFRLRAEFDEHALTRNAVVGDFLPPGTVFVPGSVLPMPDQDADLVFDLRDPTATAGPKIWDLGTVGPSGDRYVQPGAVFDIVFQATVLDVVLSPTPIVTGNLMKMRTVDSAGHAQSYRDRVGLAIVPPPPLALTKGVAAVANPPATYTPPRDGVTVQEGSTVTYRVVVTNQGNVADGSNYTARGADVWDVLPLQFDCADVVADSISFSSDPNVTVGCFDPTDDAYPFDPAPNPAHSVVRWIFPVDDAYAIDTVPPSSSVPVPTSLTLEYRVTIPTPLSVSQQLDNRAGVFQYATFTNVTGETIGFYPLDNIGESEVPPAANRAPKADDPSSVVIAGASVSKDGTTDITPTSSPTADANNPATSAVPGEGIDFTYYVDVPPHTTVFDGRLTDALPSQLELFPPPAPTFTFLTYDPGSPPSPPVVGATPTGFTIDANGTLAFPPTYHNDTDQVHRFQVSLRARVKPGETAQTATVENRATFTSNLQAGGPAAPSPSATHNTPVIQPQPTLLKTNSAPPPLNLASIGEIVQYTLRAGNTAGRPALYDSVVTDCIPAGLVFTPAQAGDNTPSSGPTAGDGTNGCPSGTTRITFDTGTVAAGTPVERRYSVTVSTAAVGGDTYINRAALVGSTLPNGVNDPPHERVIQVLANSTVRVPDATIDKSVSPTRATIGEQVTYTVHLRAPRLINLYNFAIRDVLPPGIDAGIGTDPGTVQLVSVTCAPRPNLQGPLPPATCPPPAGGTQLTPATSGSDRVVAVLIGDVLAQPYDRVYTLTFTARIDNATGIDAGDTITNTASAVWDATNLVDPTSSGHAWNRTGGTATAVVAVLEPDVRIAKGVVSATPEPGGTFTYTVSVTNPGADRTAAYALTVVDTVPVGVVVDTATISNGGAYNATTRQITWDGTDLPGPLCGTRSIGDVTPCAGATSYTLTYQARLAASSTLTDNATLVNTADVTHYEGLPPVEPNANRRIYDGPSTTATVTPHFPQLTTFKTNSGAPTYIGDAYTWTITTTNIGNGIASAVGVTDVLPPNWAYVPGSAQVTRPSGTTQIEPTTAGCAPNVLCWSGLGTLAPNQVVSVVFRATPGPGVVASPGVGSAIAHINSTSATAQDATGATGNASGTYGAGPATAQTRIDAVNLVMSKTHSDTPVAGSQFRWFLDVRNASTTDTGVGPFRVTDTLPSGATYGSAVGDGWTCSNTAQVVTCNRTNGADIIGPAGTFPRITVTVTLPSDMPAGTSLTNTATVEGKTFETIPANNTAIDTITVTAQADLAIVKNRTGEPAPIVAGELITYTLDVTNFGPSTSRANIVVTDPIPAQTTFVSAAGDGWDCPAPVAGLLTCTRATDLLFGAAAPQITMTVLAASNATGTIANLATVTGTTPDPVITNNSDPADGPVTQVADLKIDKRNTTFLSPGQNATYRLRVDNLGPSDAAPTVRITDNLPTGLTFVSATSVGGVDGIGGVAGVWSCPAAVGAVAVTCELVDDLTTPDAIALPAGAYATVDITVFVASNVQGAIRNTASVESPTTDPNPGNNTDFDDARFTGSADLAIVKTAPSAVTAGSALAWNLIVTNIGPSDSIGTPDHPIVVTDTLPNSVRFVSTVVTGAWSCTHDGAPVGGVVTCRYAATIPGIPAPPAPPTPPSSAPPIVINSTALVDAGPATIVNRADVTGVTPDPILGNNHDDAEVVVTDLTDLTITKTADPTVLNAGETTDFTFVVSNAGPSMADNVVVSDVLPAGLTVDTITVDPAEWACSNLLTSFTCSRPALLPVPAVAPVIVVTVRVDSGVPSGTEITNIGTVSTASPESNKNNNTDEASIDVDALADLGVTKVHTPQPATAGTDVEFTVTVTNNGPSDAVVPVVVVDTLPPGFRYTSHTGPWACEAPLPADPSIDQVVTCTYEADGVSIPLPASVTPAPIVMTVAIDPSVPPTAPEDFYVNHAEVSSPTPDDNEANDDADDPVAVVASADLAIVKSHPAESVRVGDPTTFTLRVTNLGPSTATDVVVADTLPNGLTYVSHEATGWTCTVLAPSISCTLDDDLLPGEAPPIAVTVSVTPAAYPRVDNVATVTSPTPDPVEENNTTTDPVTVPPQVDLAIVKVHAGGAIRVGSTTGYSLTVTNNGPTSDPGPISITDTLPAGLTPVSASGDGLTCAISGSTVRCTSTGPLAVGASVTVAITANVEAAAYPSVTNTANVATPSEETSLTNNSSTTSDPVEPLVILELTKSLESQLGSSAVWSFVVTNRGPNATVVPIVVTDPLPSGLVFEGASGDGWICVAPTNVVTCTYSASLAVGSSAPLLRIATTISAPRGSTIVNVASVDGGGPDTPAVTSQATVTTPSAGLPITGGDPGTLGRFAALVGLLGLGLFALSRRRRRLTTPPT